MLDGAILFSSIVNKTVVKLRQIDDIKISEAVEKSIKETIDDAKELDALLQYSEMRCDNANGSSYQSLVDDLTSEVEYRTENGKNLDIEPMEAIECDDEITPDKPWYIAINQTFLEWEETRELLGAIDCNIPLKELTEDEEIITHVNIAMFENREDAESVWEDMIPSAVLMHNDDGDPELSVVDVEFGVIDFRPNPHPLLIPANGNLNYNGSDYIYLLPIANRAMVTEPDSGLWTAVDFNATEGD